MSPASGYMGEKYFQEFGPRIFACPQLVGSWVKNVFRNLVPDFWTCPTAKKGHIYKGGWISVVRRVFTGGVIIMESRVVFRKPVLRSRIFGADLGHSVLLVEVKPWLMDIWGGPSPYDLSSKFAKSTSQEPRGPSSFRKDASSSSHVHDCFHLPAV